MILFSKNMSVDMSKYESLLGANIFLHPMYDPAIHVIDDTFVGSELYLNKGLSHWSSDFELNSIIPIKELRLITFDKQNPYQTISSSIFTLKNVTKSGMAQKYFIKVSDLISYMETRPAWF